MRKATQINQPKQQGTLVVEGAASIKAALGYLDANAKRRGEAERNIKHATDSIRMYKQDITRLSKGIREKEEARKKAQTELEALPLSKISEADVKAQLESITKLPWVAKVKLMDNRLFVDTLPGALKTTFYKRYVYSRGRKIMEPLHEPLTLDMPTYQIFVNLENLGGNWDRNDALQIKLLDVQAMQFMPPSSECGFNQAAYAHWATSESYWFQGSGHREANFGPLCLNQYRGVLDSAGAKGLSELLNEVVLYLQQAGWAHAYRYKLDWATQLGYQPYMFNLTRPLLPSETFESVQAASRVNLPKLLREYGVSQHMYEYGSEAEGADGNPHTADAIADRTANDMVNELLQGQMMRHVPLPNASNWEQFVYTNVPTPDVVVSNEDEPPTVPF